jgi:hypothetical protein
LVHQIHIFYIFWWTNFIWTLFGRPNFSLLFLVHQIHIFYVYWSTNFIFFMFLVHKFHFYVFCPPNSYFSLFLVHKNNLNVFGGPNSFFYEVWKMLKKLVDQINFYVFWSTKFIFT